MILVNVANATEPVIEGAAEGRFVVGESEGRCVGALVINSSQIKKTIIISTLYKFQSYSKCSSHLIIS